MLKASSSLVGAKRPTCEQGCSMRFMCTCPGGCHQQQSSSSSRRRGETALLYMQNVEDWGLAGEAVAWDLGVARLRWIGVCLH
jgi:hypothetical protein